MDENGNGNYKDKIVKNTLYRRLFQLNHLPDIYNGLTYFRRSERAMKFFNICQSITENWTAFHGAIGSISIGTRLRLSRK
jgi:hypothetical protein